MSLNVLNDEGQAPSSPSNASPARPQPQDFTALASALQAIAQVLLKYGKTIDGAEPSGAQAPSQSKQNKQATFAGAGLLEPDLLTGEQCIQFSYYPDGTGTPAFRELYSSIIDGYKRGQFHDEIRFFTVSASVVRKEQELFGTYNCCYLYEALEATYDELSIIIKLLSSLNENEALPASEIYLISENLSKPLEKLRALYVHLEAFTLVHTVIVPK